MNGKKEIAKPPATSHLSQLHGCLYCIVFCFVCLSMYQKSGKGLVMRRYRRSLVGLEERLHVGFMIMGTQNKWHTC